MLTLEIMMKAAFGSDNPEAVTRLGKLYTEEMAALANPVLPLVPDFLPFGPVASAKKIFSNLKAVADELVAIRQQSLEEEGDDACDENSKIFVDLLLKARE